MTAEPIRVEVETRFAVVPMWVVLADVSPSAVRLYAVLGDHADREGRATVYRSTLAREMRCSRNTLDRTLAELEGIGALGITPQMAPDKPKQRLASVYLLRTLTPPVGQGHLTDGVALTPPVGQKASKSLKSLKDIASPPAPRFPRSRDLVFEALEDVFGKAPVGRLRGSWNVATKELKDSGVEPDEIRRLVEFARGDRSSEWRVSTPKTLAANVGMLRRMLADRPRRPYDPDPDWSAILEQEREANRAE